MAIDRKDTIYIYKTRTGEPEIINREEWAEKVTTDRISSLDALVNSGRLLRDEPPFYMGIAGEDIETERVLVGTWQGARLANFPYNEYLGISASSARKGETFLFKNQEIAVIDSIVPLGTGERIVPVPGGQVSKSIVSTITFISSKTADNELDCDNSVFSVPSKIAMKTEFDDPFSRGGQVTVHFLDENLQYQSEVLVFSILGSHITVFSQKKCSKLLAITLGNSAWGSKIEFRNETGALCADIAAPMPNFSYGVVTYDAPEQEPFGHRFRIESMTPIVEPILIISDSGEFEVIPEITAGGVYTTRGFLDGKIRLFVGGDLVVSNEFSVFVESTMSFPSVGVPIDIAEDGSEIVVALNYESFKSEYDVNVTTFYVSDFKGSVRAATDGPLDTTYDNGTYGVGAKLTSNVNGVLSLDGVAVAGGNRVLVKDQAVLGENGIYVVLDIGSLTTPFILERANDANSGDRLTSGTFVYVEEGAVSGEVFFTMISPDPIVIGTTDIVFQKLAGVVYFADDITLELIGGDTFQVKNGGIGVDQLASGIDASGKGFIAASVGGSGALELQIFRIEAGRDAEAVIDQYLDGVAGVSMVDSPMILPFDATLIAISASSPQSKTWDVEIHLGEVLVPGATLSLSGVTSAYSAGYSIDFNAGDGLQIFLSGDGGDGNGVPYPRVDLIFKRR